MNYVTISNKLNEKILFYHHFPFYNILRLCIAESQKKMMLQLTKNADQLLKDIESELNMNREQAHLNYDEFESLVTIKNRIKDENEVAISVVQSISMAQKTLCFMYN